MQTPVSLTCAHVSAETVAEYCGGLTLTARWNCAVFIVNIIFLSGKTILKHCVNKLFRQSVKYDHYYQWILVMLHSGCNTEHWGMFPFLFLCAIICFKWNISLLTVLSFKCTVVCASVTGISSVKTQPDAITVKPQQRKKLRIHAPTYLQCKRYRR